MKYSIISTFDSNRHRFSILSTKMLSLTGTFDDRGKTQMSIGDPLLLVITARIPTVYGWIVNTKKIKQHENIHIA